MSKPREILDFAQKLLKSASSPIEYRAVIEQAYYSAFHAAREFEGKLPHRSLIGTGGTGSHDALIRSLEVPGANLEPSLKYTSKYVGAQLRMFKPIREQATYEISEPCRVEQAEDAIEKAKDIVSECEAGLRKLARP